MVILMFLRNFWVTLIPWVTVLSLAGSFAAMYLCISASTICR